MANKYLYPLLKMFSDGQFHSGEAIGSSLGVSRTAVWKHLQILSSLGLSVESVKGKGYRLVGGLQLLSEPEIRRCLNAETLSILSQVDVLMQTNSTNDMAMEYVLQPSTAYVCLAERQLAGRGRRGREWVSPIGHNIYMSVAWQFEDGISRFEGLSLAVGVEIAKILSGIGLDDVQLKWPNDILWQGRKLGGVLLEMSGDPSGVGKIVVGVGLNVKMPDNILIDQPWAYLEEALPSVSRNQLVSALIDSLAKLVSQFHLTGFAPYQHDWEVFDAYRGQVVVVSSGNKKEEGVAAGVLENGALRLQVGDREQSVYGGEVSLRLSSDS